LSEAGDTLFKGLTIVSIFFIILIVFSQTVLPPLVSKTAETRLLTATNAEKADVNISTSPAILFLLGQIDHIDMTAENAMIGQVRVKELRLKGENVHIDIRSFVQDSGEVVRSADKLELTGTIGVENLTDLLTRKVDKLKDAEVTITPNGVKVTGNVLIAGRKADVSLEGTILGEDGAVYFHMTKLNIHNAILGKAVISNFFGDILLTDLKVLPFKVELDDVVQKNDEVVITASYHNK